MPKDRNGLEGTAMHTSRSAGSGLAGAAIMGPTSFTFGGNGRGTSSARSPLMTCNTSSCRASGVRKSMPCLRLSDSPFRIDTSAQHRDHPSVKCLAGRSFTWHGSDSQQEAGTGTHVGLPISAVFGLGQLREAFARLYSLPLTQRRKLWPAFRSPLPLQCKACMEGEAKQPYTQECSSTKQQCTGKGSQDACCHVSVDFITRTAGMLGHGCC